MPATAKLLARIAKLPLGAVILPGLDMTLDDPSWALIAGNDGMTRMMACPPTAMPQFAMHALLDRIGIDAAPKFNISAQSPMGAKRWCRKPCARRPPPNTGARALPTKEFDADIRARAPRVYR